MFEMRRSMPAKVSARTVASASDRQRKQAKLGQTPVSAPSKSTYKWDDYYLNAAFEDDFESVDHKDCSDGGAILVVDIAETVRKIVCTTVKRT